jgi:predicted glycogen debranching enzyme
MPAQVPIDERSEWLEADGLSGFASGTTSTLRTRRYHALLTAADERGRRFALVNALEVTLLTPRGEVPLSSHRYAPGVVHPDGMRRITGFSLEPWPTWRYLLEGGGELVHELFVPRGQALVALAWRLTRPDAACKLRVRPLLSGRDLHALHHENHHFQFLASSRGGRVSWTPYPGVPEIHALGNGRYRDAPDWYRSFLYLEERERGFDHVEDLASPGEFTFDLDQEAVLLLGAELPSGRGATTLLVSLRQRETKRRAALAPLEHAAEAYLVRRAGRKTIVAGYPWFSDWGRDTFLSLRGLCLATGRLELAREILCAWAGSLSEGMLPNRFPDGELAAEYNSVDASLWFAVAVHELLREADAAQRPVAGSERKLLLAALESILDAYTRGTRYGIRADQDGLLACGEPGVQLTWMDAKVGDHVVTPRIGKPVEIQALWINALRIGALRARGGQRFAQLAQRASESFAARYWDAERGGLFDVVDCDHHAGAADRSLRPNQILAVGGLPFALLSGERARAVTDLVEQRLWTPLGLRSLAPGEPGYCGRYEGGPAARDSAYHQGTVWPWLLGPFVDAWVRVRGSSDESRQEARRRFLEPLLDHAGRIGLLHLPEIADGDPPHAPRGCPFQAWSVGEALRLERALRVGVTARVE